MTSRNDQKRYPAPNDDHRCRSLIRCLRVRRAIEGRASVRIASLASQFRVSERTIRRDLIALQAAGERVPAWRHKELEA